MQVSLKKKTPAGNTASDNAGTSSGISTGFSGRLFEEIPGYIVVGISIAISG